MSYNLLEENWIPVLWSDGRTGRVGIKDALKEAGNIRQIAASNPMDNVALLRFLLAILVWCKPIVSEEEREAARKDRALPTAWVAKLDQNKDCFELLGDGRRFYQDLSQAKERPKRPVSDLFAYLPADTEINHFRHVFDQTVALCPACCAVGLVRLPACATQGGQGLSPSINNAPPIYFVAAGDALLETFLLNWPVPVSEGDQPAWEPTARRARTAEIGILEGFTWQPRAVRIGPCRQNPGQRCARCGSDGPLASQLVFKKGRARKGDARPWRDPSVALVGTESRGKNSGGRESRGGDGALRCPDPVKNSASEAKLWRRRTRAILESLLGENESCPIPALAHARQRRSQLSSFRLACFEPFTKQAKKFDEDVDMWSVPAGLPRNSGLVRAALQELRHLDEFDLDGMLNRALDEVLVRAPRRNAKTNLWIKAAPAAAAAEQERALREHFEQLLRNLAEAEGDEAVRQCIADWRLRVETILCQELGRACHLIVGGSPLRRQEAINCAEWELRKAMARWAEAGSESPDENERRIARDKQGEL